MRYVLILAAVLIVAFAVAYLADNPELPRGLWNRAEGAYGDFTGAAPMPTATATLTPTATATLTPTATAPMITAVAATWEAAISRPRTTIVRFACTGSMEPTITCGDKGEFLVNFEADDIPLGSIILFPAICGELVGAPLRYSGIVHRIIEIDRSLSIVRYRTKGDANSVNDRCLVHQADVEGVLQYLYRDGERIEI